MSRTFKKYIKTGICCGSNTEWYRDRRRAFRRKAKQNLHKDGEDFVNPEDTKPYVDHWGEPTDGFHLYRPQDVTDATIEAEANKRYPAVRAIVRTWRKKMQRKMKHFHYNKWYYKKAS